MNFISPYLATPCMHAYDAFVTLIRSIAVTVGAGKESQPGGALFVGPFLA